MTDDSVDKTVEVISALSKPAETLIEKISNAVGVLYEPNRIIRKAYADATANELKTVSDIRIPEMQHRAANRLLQEETMKQHNMESITGKSLPCIREDTNPSNIEDDWIVNFFDKSRLTSNEQIQTLWAKLLAGEANSPGSYSKRTVNLLSSLDQSDAEIFTCLCRFVLDLDGLVPLLYDIDDLIYVENKIDFDTLSHLDSIGLIYFDAPGYKQIGHPKELDARYYEELVHIEFPSEFNEMVVGQALFTRSGKDLATVCNSSPIPGFLDYVLGRWMSQKLITSSFLKKPVKL